MLWIGRGVGQKFYIDDRIVTLKKVGINNAVIDIDGEQHNMTITEGLKLQGCDCTIILRGTRPSWADFNFDAPEAVKIYREEIYGDIQRRD